MIANSAMQDILSVAGEGVLASTLLDIAGQHVVILDAEHRIVYCGNTLATLLDYSVSELLGKYLYDFMPVNAPELDIVLAAGQAHAFDAVLPFAFTRRDGSIAYSSCNNRHVFPDHEEPQFTIFTLPDPIIPLETSDPQQIRTAVLEEFNHRVRNNLAIICALLDMELLHAPEHERGRLLISLARTRSLSLVHNQAQDADGCLEIGKLARDVVDSIGSIYRTSSHPVTITASSGLSLNARRAANLALVLTELIVPVIRCSGHAEANRTEIDIAQDGETACITVKGPACAADASCGLQPLSREILTGLVQRSLKGKIESLSASPVYALLRIPLG